MTNRQSTHGHDCWDWGPRHYECARREIELLVAEWKRVTAAQGEAKARVERLEEALREAYRQVRELCDCYGNPYPEASFVRYEDLLRDKEEGHEQ